MCGDEEEVCVREGWSALAVARFTECLLPELAVCPHRIIPVTTPRCTAHMRSPYVTHAWPGGRKLLTRQAVLWASRGWAWVSATPVPAAPRVDAVCMVGGQGTLPRSGLSPCPWPPLRGSGSCPA